MTVWRYIAVSREGGTGGEAARVTGETSGATSAEVRASLRRIGLSVLEVKPVRRIARTGGARWFSPIAESWRRHLRTRRRSARAELCDSLATMLESGLPLLESVRTLLGGSRRGRRRARQHMLLEVEEGLRSGDSLADAMGRLPAWFDQGEIAMVEAGQHSGELARVLRILAEQHERSGKLNEKLLGAMSYPAVVSLIGLGVVVFLSVKTLPELTSVLEGAGVEVPQLTLAVMAFGQFIASNWLLIGFAVAFLIVAALLLPALLRRAGLELRCLDQMIPSVARRIAVANLAARLADLVRAGIPMMQALRIAAPTLRFRGLRRRLEHAAAEVERGDDLAAALSDPLWFESEFVRLIEVGQATGDLPDLLERLSQRYRRQSDRLIDRLTTLLEPAVIVVLATLVGVVVMAVVAALTRLQQII